MPLNVEPPISFPTESSHRKAQSRRAVVPLPTRVPRLIETGFTPHSIAVAARIAPSTLNESLKSGTTTARTARRLLAADMDTAPRQPAWRATRRLRALAAAGVPVDTLAEEVGTHRAHLDEILHGKTEQIRRGLFIDVDRVWRARQNDPVSPAPRAVAACRWAVPWGWDDIDDPEVDLHADVVTEADAVHAAIRRARKQFGAETTAAAIGVHRYELAAICRRPRILTSRANRILGDLRRLRARERDAMIRAGAAA